MTPQQQHFEMIKHKLVELRSMAQYYEPNAPDRALPRSRRPEDLAKFDADHRSLIEEIEYLDRYVSEHEQVDRPTTI